MAETRNIYSSEITAKSFKFHEIVDKITKENLNDDESLFDVEKIIFKPKTFFGISCPKKILLEFLDDDCSIVYPVGNYLAYYDLKTDKTQYKYLHDSLNLRGFFMFKELSYLILEEDDLNKKHHITFINKSLNKFEVQFDKNTIDLGSNSELIDLSISKDGTKCGLILKNPEWMLSVWCMNTFTLISQRKVFTSVYFKKSINQLSFYPSNNKKLILFGNSVLSGFDLSNTDLTSDWNFELASNYVSHLWLSENQILIGDDSGQVILFNLNSIHIEKILNLGLEFLNENELFSKFKENSLNKYYLNKVEGNPENNEILNNRSSSVSVFKISSFSNSLNSNSQNSSDTLSNNETKIDSVKFNEYWHQEIDEKIGCFAKQLSILKINQIIGISNGFIGLIGDNKIGIYLKSSMNSYDLNCIGFLNSKEINQNTCKNNSQEKILNIALNKNENILICLTNWNRFYKVDLNNQLIFNNKILNFQIIKNFHHSKIIGYETCLLKPFILTCAKENSIKLWNFETGQLELDKHFDEHIVSATISPNGLYLVVSFYNKVNYYSIILDELKCLKSFNLTQCTYCKFSNGGQLLGAINISSLHIYNIHTFNQNIELKLKFGKMQHFDWLCQDQFAICCSNSGIICIWNILTGQRLYEYIEKKISFKLLYTSLNHFKLNIFAVDRLNNIRLIKIKLDKDLQSELDNTEDLVLEKFIEIKNLFYDKSNSISAIYATRNVLIFGTNEGCVHFYNFKLDKIASWKNSKFLFHNSSISQLFLLLNSNKVELTSCSENGLIVVSELENFFHKTILDEYKIQTGWIDDILITKNEIIKQIKYDISLKQKLFDQETEQKDKINFIEMIHKNQIKTINYEAKVNLTRLRTLLRELNLANEERNKTYTFRLENFETKFKKILDLIKESSEKKLIKCYEFNAFLKLKYLKIFEKNEALKRRIEELTVESNNQENSKSYQEYKMFELENESKLILNDYKKIFQLITEESSKLELNEDQIVQKLKTEFQEQLSFYEKSNSQAKSEICLAKNRISCLKLDLENLKEENKNFNINFDTEKRRYMTKKDQVEFLKKCLQRKQHDIEFDEKNLQSALLKREKLKKNNNFQIMEAKRLEKSIPLLKLENEELISRLRSYEEKLMSIMSAKIRLYNKLKLRCLYKYEKLPKNLLFQKKRYTKQQLRIKRLIANLRKFSPTQKRLINKMKNML